MKKFIIKIVLGILALYSVSFSNDDLNVNDIPLLVKLSLDGSKIYNSFQDNAPFHLNLTFIEKMEAKHSIDILMKNKEAIKYYLDRGKKYIPVIREIFRKNGLPDDLVFLPIIESHFNIKAKSPAGAAGLWQFMPQTARMYGLEINKWIDERYDLIKSTEAAAYYLKDLYSIFDDWGLALASYNSGEGTVIRKINRFGGENFWDIRSYLSPETREYVPRFLGVLSVVKTLLKEEDIKSPDFDVVQVDKPVSLELISTLLKIPYSKLIDLNPQLLKGKTPPVEGTYNIYLPKGYGATLEAILSDMKLERFKALKEYEVKKGDTLITIAKKFNTTVEYLKKINDLRHGYIIANTYIKVPTTIEAYPLYSYDVVDLTEDIEYTEKGIIYKVKKGDTLAKIAKKFGTTVYNLKRWNKINDYILPNQKLVIYKKILNANITRKAMEHRVNYIKRKVNKRKPKFKYIFYTVKKGDTLAKIAEKFSVKIEDIKKWNNLKSDIIVVNDRLTIIKRIVEK
jgi:membrane-bound lytic murein transglycosylase D